MLTKRKSITLRLLLCLFLLVGSICVGCSDNRESDANLGTETTAGFLEAAEPVTDSENLSEIHSDFLSTGDYSIVLDLGGNLLLVRSYVPESENDATADDEEWGYEEDFSYQFDLYSLKDNAITASLNTEEFSCNFYQIVGSELYLVDYEENVLRRYDANLSSLGTYDTTDLLSVANCFLYASAEADSCYVIGTDNHTLLKVTFTENNYTISECQTDYYCSIVSMSSPDASKLLMITVDKDTFLSGCRVVNTVDLSDLVSCSQDGLLYSVISDDAFLAQTSDEAEPYKCSWFGGETVYFAEPESSLVSLMGGLISVTGNMYADETDDAFYDRYVYDSSGNCVSAMSYNLDPDGDGETDIYIASEPVYFEEYNCALILANDVEDGIYLLVWNLGISGNVDDIEPLTVYASAEDVLTDIEADTASSTDAETVTMIPDRDSYDWGDLADVRSRADDLEESYGISIYLGPETPPLIGDSYSAEQCLDVDVLTLAMDSLDNILGLYPENFFAQLCYGDIQGIRVYLTGTLSGNYDGIVADPYGYITTVNNYKVMVLDVTLYWNWDYTINHEISHLIDTSLEYRSIYQQDALYSEETWSSYNPIGFDYLYTADDYQYNTDYDTWSEYFVSYYSTTYPTEDRAEIFGYVMSDALNVGLY